MNLPVTVWGVHMGEHVGSRPIDLGYVAIGWPALGDLRQYPDRDALRAALEVRYAEKKNPVHDLSTQASCIDLPMRCRRATSLSIHPHNTTVWSM